MAGGDYKWGAANGWARRDSAFLAPPQAVQESATPGTSGHFSLGTPLPRRKRHPHRQHPASPASEKTSSRHQQVSEGSTIYAFCLGGGWSIEHTQGNLMAGKWNGVTVNGEPKKTKTMRDVIHKSYVHPALNSKPATTRWEARHSGTPAACGAPQRWPAPRGGRPAAGLSRRPAWCRCHPRRPPPGRASLPPGHTGRWSGGAKGGTRFPRQSVAFCLMHPCPISYGGGTN